MPKEVFKIESFHGGINDNSSPRDIRTDEVVSAKNCAVDSVGAVKTIGAVTAHASSSNSTTINPGYGLFTYSTDFNLAGSESTEDWLVMADTSSAANLDFYDRDAGGSPAWSTARVDLGSSAGMKPAFYVVDGVLRVSDGSFSNTNQWHGYLKNYLYHTTESNASNGTPVHEITEWIATDQQLKSFDDLSVTCQIAQCNSASPAASKIGDGSEKAITIAYWKNPDGVWRGEFQIGITPLYIGGQEGEISIADGAVSGSGAESKVINLANEKLSVQAFISMGTGTTITADSAHKLGDDRIVGINVYFRKINSEAWALLQSFDLMEGGGRHWKVYNATTQSAYGYFNGTITATLETTGGTAIVEPKSITAITSADPAVVTANAHGFNNNDIVSIAGVQGMPELNGKTFKVANKTTNTFELSGENSTDYGAYASEGLVNKYVATYADMQMNVAIASNSNSQVMEVNKTVFLRVKGGFVDPVYLQIDNLLQSGDSGYADHEIDINMNDRAGIQEFQVELLDEHFGVMKTDKVSYAVSDGGLESVPVDSDPYDPPNWGNRYDTNRWTRPKRGRWGRG